LKSPILRLVIVGGGISGLATAYYAYQFARESGISLDCTVLERDARLGGKIVTERLNGHVIEGGPESFVTRKPWALALCRELGLQDRLLSADDTSRNYVLHHGQPVPVPATPQGFLRTPLLSFPGKLRAAQEVVIPARNGTDDESLGHLVRRRFGDEVLDNLVAPAVGSIYLSDVDQLSTQVSFDRFLKLEQQHGSLLKGMMIMQRTMRRQAKERDNGDKPTSKPAPFVTLPNGLSELVGAIAERLVEFGCELHTNARAIQITKSSCGGYAIVLDDGRTLETDAIVLAVPAFAMADLIESHVGDAIEYLRLVRYVSVATVTLAYRRADVSKQFDGFGIVVPAGEALPLLACEVTSNKWPGRADDRYILLRAFVGGHRNEALVDQPDDALVEMSHRAIAPILDIMSKPAFARVFRWQPGNPQYPVGYLNALAKVEAQLETTLPNVFLTGAAMRGLGIPDCVRQASETASRVLNALNAARVTAKSGQPETKTA
jgi:oxygen-dependent protoporphyrinogen oxidase